MQLMMQMFMIERKIYFKRGKISDSSFNWKQEKEHQNKIQAKQK